MKTMLDSRAGPPGTSPSRSARIPSTIWWTISAVDRFRSSPACPVAQNGQLIPHLGARPGGDVGPLLRVVRVPREVVLRELLGTKRLLADRGDGVLALT